MSKRQSLSEQKQKQKARRRANRMALFGTTAPSPERDSVLAKFQHIMTACQANDPADLLAFLREQRRGWTLEHDGPSELMNWVDEWKKVTAS